MQYYFTFNEQEQYNTDDFIISDSNKDVMGYIDNWPEWGNSIYSKILLINSAKDSGKTHISYMWQEKTGAARLSYNDIASSNNLIKSISMNNAIIFEDIDQNFFDERIWFHFINMVVEQQKFLLLTSSLYKNEMQIKLPDLRSRINAIPSIEIYAPDDNLMKALMIKKFCDRNIRINLDVIEYSVLRIERSFYSIFEFVELINKKSLAEKRSITIPMARDIILAMNSQDNANYRN